jgi:hypothetical protein
MNYKYLQRSKSKTNTLAIKMKFGFVPCFEGGNILNQQNHHCGVKTGKKSEAVVEEE